MAKTKQAKTTLRRRPWYVPSLTTQILIGLVLGGLIGYLGRKWGYNWGNNVYFLRDIFLNLIKSIIAPLIFATLVVGIAGGGDLKQVGRMGAKALLYFEIVTTIALFIHIAAVSKFVIATDNSRQVGARVLRNSASSANFSRTCLILSTESALLLIKAKLLSIY